MASAYNEFHTLARNCQCHPACYPGVLDKSKHGSKTMVDSHGIACTFVDRTSGKLMTYEAVPAIFEDGWACNNVVVDFRTGEYRLVKSSPFVSPAQGKAEISTTTVPGTDIFPVHDLFPQCKVQLQHPARQSRDPDIALFS